MTIRKSVFAKISLACSIISMGFLIALPLMVNKFQIMRVSPSGFAFSLIRPIFFIIPLIGFIFAFLFSYIARRGRNANGEVSNVRKTTLIIGVARIGIGMVIILFVVSNFLQSLAGANAMARREVCRNNIEALIRMCHMYADDYDGRFPLSFKALNEAGYEIGNLIKCPTDSRTSSYKQYGLNIAATQDCPSNTPLIGDFDSSNHSDDGGNIGYVDGSVRWYKGGFWHPGTYSAGSGPLEDVAPEDWVRQ